MVYMCSITLQYVYQDSYDSHLFPSVDEARKLHRNPFPVDS